jgi:hypothetical protein
MPNPVSLTVHRNTRTKRAERDRAAVLMRRAREAARIDGGLAGFALVAWNASGEPSAWWDCGQLPPWSLPDFARRVLETSQDLESEQAADG